MFSQQHSKYVLPSELLNIVFEYSPKSGYLTNKQFTMQYLKSKYERIELPYQRFSAVESMVFNYASLVKIISMEGTDLSELEKFRSATSLILDSSIDLKQVSEKLSLKDLQFIPEIRSDGSNFDNFLPLFGTISHLEHLTTLQIPNMVPEIIIINQLKLLENLGLSLGNFTSYKVIAPLVHIKHLKVYFHVPEQISQFGRIFPNLSSCSIRNTYLSLGSLRLSDLKCKSLSCDHWRFDVPKSVKFLTCLGSIITVLIPPLDIQLDCLTFILDEFTDLVLLQKCVDYARSRTFPTFIEIGKLGYSFNCKRTSKPYYSVFYDPDWECYTYYITLKD
eukprot:NODE_432_length_7521_cov_0.745891.p2 type:complete len:334 gc:universal NODE_432_length_7521_cov_0.745891:3616-4617(+)